MMIKNCLSVLWRIVFANVVAIFAVLGVSTVFTSALTTDIGYTAYGSKDGVSNQQLYTYYYSDGEDTQKQEYEDLGYTISISNIRSDLTKPQRNAFLVVSQFVTLCVSAYFLYGIVWSFGNKDSNRVRFGRIKEDKLRGFKMGLLATSPYFLLYLLTVIFSFGIYDNFSMILYKFVNGYAFGFIDMILGETYNAAGLSITQILLLFVLLFIPALVCGIAYILGYKDISVMEKIVFKNNKKDVK